MSHFTFLHFILVRSVCRFDRIQSNRRFQITYSLKFSFIKSLHSIGTAIWLRLWQRMFDYANMQQSLQIHLLVAHILLELERRYSHTWRDDTFRNIEADMRREHEFRKHKCLYSIHSLGQGSSISHARGAASIWLVFEWCCDMTSFTTVPELHTSSSPSTILPPSANGIRTSFGIFFLFSFAVTHYLINDFYRFTWFLMCWQEVWARQTFSATFASVVSECIATNYDDIFEMRHANWSGKA